MTCFLLGAIVALAGVEEIRVSGGVFRSRALKGLLVYLGVAALPIAVFCYVVFPDWCWMYWVDPRRVPLGAVVAAYAAYVPLALLGFAGAYALEVRRKLRGLKMLEGAAVVFLVFNGVTSYRFLHVGTREAFFAGAAPFLWEQPPFSEILAALMVGAIGGFIALVRWTGRGADYRWTPADRAPGERPVSLVRVTGGVPEALDRSLAAWGGAEHLKKAAADRPRSVLIKPNLGGGGKDRRGTQTSIEALGAVVDWVRKTLPEHRLAVVESDMIFWRMPVLLRGSRYEEYFRRAGVEFVNLSREELVDHDFGGRLGRERIPRLLAERPLLIDVPVPKTHAFFALSGAVKNLFGLLPHPRKLFAYHARGAGDEGGRIFLDLLRSFPPDLVVVDGLAGTQGHGPLGDPIELGFLATSPDPVAVDLTLAEVMGMDPRRVPYLRILLDAGAAARPKGMGVPPRDLAPPRWRKASRLRGLAVNAVRIVGEHLRDRSRSGAR